MMTTPSAASPASASDFGPAAPMRMRVGTSGGQSSATSSSRTYSPSMLTVSPASSLRRATRYSPISVSGDDARAPTWPIHSCTPCPTQGGTGRRASGRASRSPSPWPPRCAAAPGSSPSPTTSRCDSARAVAAEATPPSRKQSSHSHTCSSPTASACRKRPRMASGGDCGRITTPTSTVMPQPPTHATRSRADFQPCASRTAIRPVSSSFGTMGERVAHHLLEGDRAVGSRVRQQPRAAPRRARPRGRPRERRARPRAARSTC